LIRTPRAKKAAPSPWEFRQHPDAAVLLTSNLLIPAVANVTFPGRGLASTAVTSMAV